MLMSIGFVRKLEDASHTNVTSPTSGTYGNSTPARKTVMHRIKPTVPVPTAGDQKPKVGKVKVKACLTRNPNSELCL